MILDWSKVRMFVKPGPTDMRKQINGLSIVVAEELAMDPLDGSLFLFCNKQRRILKVIYWDRNGFCLWLKKLEKDKFPWPAKVGVSQRFVTLFCYPPVANRNAIC